MLIDLEKEGSGLDLDADVCVVGAGAVGLVLALDLARKGARVVLLEGGGLQLESKSQDLHRGRSVGRPFANIEVGRYRVLGGTTTFWGGQVMPVSQHIFEPRPWLTDAVWPFGHEALAPYFEAAQQMIGVGEALWDDKSVWRRLALQAPDLGPDLDVLLTRWTPKRNFARLFGREIRQSKTLQVVLHANVTGVSVDREQRRITSTIGKSLQGGGVTVRSGITVLANGTLEIARLLLQPATDGLPPPWYQNKWIGRGFCDHLDAAAGSVKILNKNKFEAYFDNIFIDRFKYYPRIRLSESVQLQNKLVDVSAQFTFNTKYSYHLDRMKMFARSLFDGQMPKDLWSLPAHSLAVAKIVMPLVIRYIRQHRSFKPGDASVQLVLSCEQIPVADSVVRLGKELDPLGMRRIEINWNIDGREIETMAQFATLIKQQLASRGLAEVDIDPDLERRDPVFLEKVYDAVHQMSTARIGLSPDDGVVDADLRVHGMENLYVLGAAAFPTGGFANPTLTAIALGLRLGDHLRQVQNG